MPAAGYARRLGPLEGSKEVLDVRGTPVMRYLVDRLEAAGCDEIRVVTRPEKRDVAAEAERVGATIVLGRPETVAASILLGAEGAQAGDVVLFGFPDTIWEPPEGFVQLLPELSRAPVVLGVFRGSEPERSDVVSLEPDGRVARIDVKPAEPAGDLIWGCAAVRAPLLVGLAEHAEAGDYFDELCRDGRVVGVRLSDVFLDIGTPEALALARS